MNEVEGYHVADRLKVRPRCRDGQFTLQGSKAFEPEHRVLEIARAVAILKSAVRVDATRKKLRRQIRGVTERFRRQSRDLQHFESQTHRTNLRFQR